MKILAAVANEHGFKIFHSDVAQACVHSELDSEIYMNCGDMSGNMFRHNRYMKLPDGCGDMSGNIVRLNRSPYGLK